MKLFTHLLESFPELPRSWKIFFWNFYPPFVGAGIRITELAEDFTSAEVKLSARWWNRNYVGSHFGGSIYAMCDFFHMVLLIELLGPGYIVRDKGADLRFLKKGTGILRAHFAVDASTVAEIWNNPSDVQERKFLVQVKNEAGEVVAEVTKILHIRRTGA